MPTVFILYNRLCTLGRDKPQLRPLVRERKPYHLPDLPPDTVVMPPRKLQRQLQQPLVHLDVPNLRPTQQLGRLDHPSRPTQTFYPRRHVIPIDRHAATHRPAPDPASPLHLSGVPTRIQDDTQARLIRFPLRLPRVLIHEFLPDRETFGPGAELVVGVHDGVQERDVDVEEGIEADRAVELAYEVEGLRDGVIVRRG